MNTKAAPLHKATFVAIVATIFILSFAVAQHESPLDNDTTETEVIDEMENAENITPNDTETTDKDATLKANTTIGTDNGTDNATSTTIETTATVGVNATNESDNNITLIVTNTTRDTNTENQTNRTIRTIETEEDDDEFDRVHTDVDEIESDVFTRAYYGHGWALSENEGGYLVQALWFRNTNEIENDTNSDNEVEIETTAGGLLKFDIGDDATKYRLTKLDSPEDTIVFAVHTFDEENDTTTRTQNRVGTLTLVRVPHSDITIWQGLLEFDSGSRNGQYHVEIGTRSVLVEGLARTEELVEDQAEDTLVEERGFLQRLLARLRG